MSSPTADSTSSTATAGCGPSDAVLADLGRRLLRELEAEPQHADTATRWLAHRLAELLEQAGAATGAARDAAADACRDTVLLIWKHRAAMPRGRRPLEAFEPILEALQRLREPRGYWYVHYDEQEGPPEGPVRDMVGLALTLDRGARDAIRLCLALAGAEAAGAEAEWVDADGRPALPELVGSDDGALSVVLALADETHELLGPAKPLAAAEQERVRTSLEDMRAAIAGLLEALPRTPSAKDDQPRPGDGGLILPQ